MKFKTRIEDLGHKCFHFDMRDNRETIRPIWQIGKAGKALENLINTCNLKNFRVRGNGNLKHTFFLSYK